MHRMIFVPLILTCVINSNLMMTSQLSLGRLFPASRNRQRASSLISQAIESSFFKRPSFQPPKVKGKSTIKSLPSFPDVLWKFNKRLVNNSDLKSQNPSKNSSSAETDLAKHFSKFGEFASSMVSKDSLKLKENTGKSQLDKQLMSESLRNEVLLNDVEQKISEINKDEMEVRKEYSTRATTPPTPISMVNKFEGVTDSPIFYIKLPAAPYEYHPSLGYISRPASPDLTSFLRPQIDFLNNGRPTNIYLPDTPISIMNTTVSLPEFITSPTLAPPGTTYLDTAVSLVESSTHQTQGEFTTFLPVTDSKITAPSSTSELTPSTSTMSEQITVIVTSSSKPVPSTSSTESTTATSFSKPSPSTFSTESTATTSNTAESVSTSLATTTSKSGYTDSPITWLKGPYFFNGRPNNLFIFKSQPNKADRFEYLHKLYSKPGVYL